MPSLQHNPAPLEPGAPPEQPSQAQVDVLMAHGKFSPSGVVNQFPTLEIDEATRAELKTGETRWRSALGGMAPQGTSMNSHTKARGIAAVAKSAMRDGPTSMGSVSPSGEEVSFPWLAPVTPDNQRIDGNINLLLADDDHSTERVLDDLFGTKK